MARDYRKSALRLLRDAARSEAQLFGDSPQDRGRVYAGITFGQLAAARGKGSGEEAEAAPGIEQLASLIAESLRPLLVGQHQSIELDSEQRIVSSSAADLPDDESPTMQHTTQSELDPGSPVTSDSVDVDVPQSEVPLEQVVEPLDVLSDPAELPESIDLPQGQPTIRDADPPEWVRRQTYHSSESLPPDPEPEVDESDLEPPEVRRVPRERRRSAFIYENAENMPEGPSGPGYEPEPYMLGVGQAGVNSTPVIFSEPPVETPVSAYHAAQPQHDGLMFGMVDEVNRATDKAVQVMQMLAARVSQLQQQMDDVMATVERDQDDFE